MKLLLDTCAVLFSEMEPDRLTEKVRKALSEPTNEIFVSAITIGEVACLAGKKINLKKHWRIWMDEALNENQWTLLPVDGPVMQEAYSLPEPFHRDPADRIMVATSRIHRIPLVTNDLLISKYPFVELYW